MPVAALSRSPESATVGTVHSKLIGHNWFVAILTNLFDCSWGYREPNYRPRMNETRFMANTAGALFWWWTLYHFYYEFGHIVGEFP